MTTIYEFEFLDHQVRIVERPGVLAAKYAAYIDGEKQDVNFHLVSSAAADARREVERMVAERRRLSGQATFCNPPSDEAYASASAESEDPERWDTCC